MRQTRFHCRSWRRGGSHRPLQPHVQQQQKSWRVGCLSSGRLNSLDSFRQRMTDLGYIDSAVRMSVSGA